MIEIVTLYTDEQRRVLINIQQHYDVWLGVERALLTLPYGMKWAERSGKQYLYELLDRTGNAKSLGARSEKTEAAYERFLRTKEDLEGRLLESRKRLAETCALYRSLLLPQIPSEAAKILREADKRRMLGDKLLVVGTNAMPAYNIEAGGRINDAPDETDDFDMTWSALIEDETRDGVMSMLKAADSTYTVNTERTFQARNAKAFEFELLAAPSTVCNMLQNDKPSPLPLPEQEWLLLGRHVNRVVVGRDGTPARLVVPDPRYFALQKLWMADQDKRNFLKRPKDAKQGSAVLAAIAASMPHFPLDEEFAQSLPAELRPYFDQWRSTYNEIPAKSPSWW